MRSIGFEIRRVAAATAALAVFTLTPAFSQARLQSHKKYAIEFAEVADFPAINNHGDVAFTGVRYGSGGVFRIREEQEKVTTIASPSNGFVAFADELAVNASGVVAFQATTTTNSQAILKGDGISRTLIADSSANGLLRINVGPPSINAAGTVAFFSVLSQRGFPGAIFKGNGGPRSWRTKAAATTGGSGMISARHFSVSAWSIRRNRDRYRNKSQRGELPF